MNLLQAVARGCLERLETLAGRLDDVEAAGEATPLAELGRLQQRVRAVRADVGRLTVVVAELGGPLGARFPGLASALGFVQAEVGHLEGFAAEVGQGLRDLLALRAAAEANRLSVATNRLGEVSNRIATIANTSNIRMLGVAYVALVLALVGAVVLIPNTAATILGMPSAGWVPGLWVDAILVVLAIVPILVVFSRPWVVRLFREFRLSEARTAEGVGDLPEVPADRVNAPGAERLLEPPP